MPETETDTLNIEASDPEDYIYVSKKNWLRKKRIQDGDADQLTKLVGRPGPITGLILSLVDMVSSLFIKLLVLLLQLSTIAFDWVNNLIFGNFKGLIPNEIKKGKVISMKWFRYAMTVLMPPFGVFLSKGVYGWFNILVCVILTYINYLLGIIYAFVITMRNRYADQYEDNEMIQALAANPPSEAQADVNALFGSIGFSIIILGAIFFMLHYF
jgi:uncharacterized membrane protein YqaE (UPF0057 family)